jgi:hypothetical protein
MSQPIRRFARRAKSRLAAPLTRRLDVLQGSIIESTQELARVQAELAAASASAVQGIESRLDALGDDLDRAWRMLRYLDDEGAASRRRLYALRASEEYEFAFEEDDPLVSYIVPTYKRFDLLRDVSLPSILGQTHANVEVIVIGDSAPPETAEVIAEIGDERIRYYNRAVRGPYPDDPSVRWYMVGTPPYNDALSMVRGRWIGSMADDDAIRPAHAETLLGAAREGRHEHCYGRHLVHYKDGNTLDLGEFPPREGKFVTQASLYHSGLRFFQMRLSDPLYKEPNDWSQSRRMLEAGVRFGMVDEVVCDKHESRYHSHDDWGAHGIPSLE